MIRKRKSTLITLLLTLALPPIVDAQSVYSFKKGLILRQAHRYGREAIYKDPLAWQMYSGSMQRPIAGSAVPGVSGAWETATADTSGRFGGRGYWGGGYLFLNYDAEHERTAILKIEGNNSVYVNGDLHAGDPYRSGWMYVPVKLKKGSNSFYVRGEYSRASLLLSEPPVSLITADVTAPDIVLGRDNKRLKAAVVIVNSTQVKQAGLVLRSTVNGRKLNTRLADVPALGMRKISFDFDASAIQDTGHVGCTVELLAGNKVLASHSIPLEAVRSTDKYKMTFVSEIDGSLQYYAVAPQTGGSVKNAALFFSVHGAGVEAIGQAKAYEAKDWGTLVAPTNRRPRGFNWEDWGRLDALEVLSIARKTFSPDPDRVYLTGHSMGGHGTWFLGATYPGNWAAIAPCAGYPTLKGYGSADGLVPDSAGTDIERALLSASNQSDIPALATNYKPFGVYVLHGDADPVVSVNYARQMRRVLAGFHPDHSYYEYPGGSHWYGNESVDWKPLFDYFSWHKRPADTAVKVVDFITASPGISSAYRWVNVWQQNKPLQYSRVKLNRDLNAATIKGSTENISTLSLALNDFGEGRSVRITLDSLTSLTYVTKSIADTVYLRSAGGKWLLASKPSFKEKGPHRYGTFKEPFNHRMIFVYGTSGSRDENAWSINKARYDAETWYYRGNGAVDVMSDKEYDAKKYAGRNVILYGNASTNSAYNGLLAGCPVRISRNEVKVGEDIWKGDDLGAYFMWPMKNSHHNSVGVIAGTGLKGMRAADANQYFAGASGFPDVMVFNLDMLIKGASGIKCAGFYDSDWRIGNNMFVKK